MTLKDHPVEHGQAAGDVAAVNVLEASMADLPVDPSRGSARQVWTRHPHSLSTDRGAARRAPMRAHRAGFAGPSTDVGTNGLASFPAAGGRLSFRTPAKCPREFGCGRRLL